MRAWQRALATAIGCFLNAYVQGMLEASVSDPKWASFFGEAKHGSFGLGCVAVFVTLFAAGPMADMDRKGQ